MWSTCFHVEDMPSMIQIRNVPDALHRKLKSRRPRRHISLQYLLAELRRMVERPTLAELRERALAATPFNSP
jgi:antitoxin FitA